MKYTAYFLLIMPLFSCTQPERVAFYNVENLFDTLDTPGFQDEDFTPLGKYQWNTIRFEDKTKHIRQVFEELNTPAVMGFAEIENLQVLQSVLEPYPHYSWVHYESADERGIDVALAYDTKKCNLIKSGNMRFYQTKGEDTNFTRDILFAEIKWNRQKFHFLVNHWPSRRGGVAETEPFRLLAAQTARKYVDSVLTQDPKANIILMGDLNDYPEDKSAQLIEEKLKPMITSQSGKLGGTNEYRGEWHVLDHIFVSNNLVSKRKPVAHKGCVLEASYLLTEYKGRVVPFRTYAGNYLGGFSDHLPVYVELSF